MDSRGGYFAARAGILSKYQEKLLWDNSGIYWRYYNIFYVRYRRTFTVYIPRLPEAMQKKLHALELKAIDPTKLKLKK